MANFERISRDELSQTRPPFAKVSLAKVYTKFIHGAWNRNNKPIKLYRREITENI